MLQQSTDEWLDGGSTEPFPSPRGLALHSFRAGLLACHHPSSAPSHVKVSHSGNSAGVVRPTAAGGCAGIVIVLKQHAASPASRFTRSGQGARNPKLGQVYGERTRAAIVVPARADRWRRMRSTGELPCATQRFALPLISSTSMRIISTLSILAAMYSSPCLM